MLSFGSLGHQFRASAAVQVVGRVTVCVFAGTGDLGKLVLYLYVRNDIGQDNNNAGGMLRHNPPIHGKKHDRST